jgi:acetyl-CoA carboxylase biotin carboxylase subunit
MLAKVIVYDLDRPRAIKRLLRALDELEIEGVPTNLEEQKMLLKSKEFQRGNFGTSLYSRLILS